MDSDIKKMSNQLLFVTQQMTEKNWLTAVVADVNGRLRHGRPQPGRPRAADAKTTAIIIAIAVAVRRTVAETS